MVVWPPSPKKTVALAGAVFHGLSDESRGDEDAGFLEFVVARCGARDDVSTADVGGVVCVSSGVQVVRVPPTRTLKT
jgi:hypothetical protein